MALLNQHLDEAALTQVWVDRALGEGGPDGAAERHLDGCVDCQSRLSSLDAWLRTAREDARAAADDVFGPERLAAQQAQILRRIETLEQPARVIAFPRFARPMSASYAPARRWVAAAAAAGLIVGVGLGQLLEFGMVRQAPADEPAQVVARSAPDAPPLLVQPASFAGDEAFLYEPQATSQPPVPESLQYLNAVTPTSRDFDPR